MEIEKIRELAEILRESGLTALEVREGEDKVRLEKAPVQAVYAQGAAAPAPSASAAGVQAIPQGSGVVDFNQLTECKSNMVGVFYSSPSPDSEPFVKIGDKVKKGDVLCIIEAMKLMNEYVAPQDGEIVDICAENGQLVEFGQCLFKLY